MNIRPIKTDADHDEALAEVRRLWNAPPGSPDADKLEVLAMLLHHYERERHPIAMPDPIEAIKFRMEQQGLSRSDLLPIFGTTGRTSEVLAGKRPLTLEMIRKLHAMFDIPLDVLVQPPPKAKIRRSSSAAKRVASSRPRAKGSVPGHRKAKPSRSVQRKAG